MKRRSIFHSTTHAEPSHLWPSPILPPAITPIYNCDFGILRGGRLLLGTLHSPHVPPRHLRFRTSIQNWWDVPDNCAFRGPAVACPRSRCDSIPADLLAPCPWPLAKRAWWLGASAISLAKSGASPV